MKALQDLGFNNLFGIDLCEEDLFIAKMRTGLETLEKADLFVYLKDKQFDVIIAKDVMEHIPKNRQEEFVKAIFDALHSGGIALIQVPNMDWLMSNHERYLDFTHEIGYTRESLGDIFRLYFENVQVVPVPYIFTNSLKRKIVFGIGRTALVKVMRFIFKVLGEGMSDIWFEYREIMAVATKK